VRLRVFAAVAILAGCAVAREAGDTLERGFGNPPESAKPRTWWHWMAGNISKEGITLDLEWMKRVGIGGVQVFDAGMGVGQYVDHRIDFMTPEWKEMLRHAAAECDRLGLEMGMHSSAGWSETGGPWVKPEQAMKKYVWSETRVEGPRRFSGVLTVPPSANGRFQNLDGNTPGPDPTYYADSAVVAYRIPDDEVPMAEAYPKVTLSSGAGNVGRLFDGDLSTILALPIPPTGQRAWVQFEFANPYRARAFSIAVRARGIPSGELRVSDDGTNFRTLVFLPGEDHNPVPVHTYTFPEATARFYRLELTAPAPVKSYEKAPTEYEIAELDLESGSRVNRWEDKAGFSALFEYDSLPTVSTGTAVARADVIDVTPKTHQDRRLEWDVPAGKWVILRLGYSLTGRKNSPAVETGRGYEVDKLDRRYVESYFSGYVSQIAEALGPLFGKSFRNFVMDSWEAGFLNWTDDMLAEFQNRRGYDPRPYLPVLTGRVIESADVSDRFLWDFRRTLADLLAENHYGAFTESAHLRGLTVSAEAAGIYLPVIEDGLANKGRVDIPMGEFWFVDQPPGEIRPEDYADLREAASAAHIYGKKLAAAESFTTPRTVTGWAQPPSYLKWLADRAMAAGINRIVFHTSVHQPLLDRKPGITMSSFGQHLTRNITWAELAGPFMTYLSRSAYLLQQGLPVADLLYYYGEGAPAVVPYWESVKPEPPAGYDSDYLNTEVLLTRLSVKDGQLVLPDGMSYRVLVLPESDRMTPRVLRKVRDLVAGGATVVGPRPSRSSSLTGYPGCDAEVWAMANELWGDADGRSLTEHAFGKGRIVWGKPLTDVLAGQGIAPDFEYSRPNADTFLVSTHRRSGDADLYFVSNQRERAEDLTAMFRMTGKSAELWHPDTGTTEPAEYTIDNGRTGVPLHLDPFGSVFVVFRHRASTPSRRLPHPKRIVLSDITGPWDVTFPPSWGAPPKVRLENLISWSDHPDDGVKYFSGSATYSKDFEASPAWFAPGSKTALNLGRVKEFAEVSLNGKPLGILWKAPFEVDVTDALQEGRNHLEIRITNLWPNRIIGDEQPAARQKYTFTAYKVFTKDSPLLESGMLGPVTICSIRFP
jgi:hypothetical protein